MFKEATVDDRGPTGRGALWKIFVAGYGTFEFRGTEDKAEEMRVHKARWERGIGLKYRVNRQTDVDRWTQKIVANFERGEGVPQAWFTARKKAAHAMLAARSKKRNLDHGPLRRKPPRVLTAGNKSHGSEAGPGSGCTETSG